MKTAVVFFPFALVLMACEPRPSVTAKMTVVDAETHCTASSKQFATQPLSIPDENGTIQVGFLAERPDSFMVSDFYKRCFYANTGQRPASIPKLPAYG
ncbi:MAG: hypothetical protein QNK92_04770 [Amylibacter sp.]